MSVQTKKNVKDKTTPANEDWGVFGNLNDTNRFKLVKKNNSVNIQDLMGDMVAHAEHDDAILDKSVQKDEAQAKSTMKKVITKSVPKTTVAKKTVQTRKPKVEQPKPVMQEVSLNEVVVEKSIASVNPQTTTSATTSQTQQVVAKEQKVDSFNALVKFMFMGFMHLYVKKTNNVLKPFEFVAQNRAMVSLAILHLIIPLFMTWFVTTRMDSVVLKLASNGALTNIGLYAAFYCSSLFVWVSAYVCMSGIYAMIKKSLVDVAKVGKENN